MNYTVTGTFYLLDSELSAGERYPLLKELEPEEKGVCLLLSSKICRQVLHSKGPKNSVVIIGVFTEIWENLAVEQ